MTDLWTPSDEALNDVAKAQVDRAAPSQPEPFDGDDASEQMAAVVLADLDGDDEVCDENGDAPDDDDVLDPDAEPTEV